MLPSILSDTMNIDALEVEMEKWERWFRGSVLDLLPGDVGSNPISTVHLGHCVIYVSMQFTHGYSRFTHPSYSSEGWQK